MENLKVLLRGLANGQSEVFENTDGSYSSIQIKGTSLVEDHAVIKDIKSRLQYELYGEYPLSQNNQSDWDRNISKSLKNL